MQQQSPSNLHILFIAIATIFSLLLLGGVILFFVLTRTPQAGFHFQKEGLVYVSEFEGEHILFPNADKATLQFHETDGDIAWDANAVYCRGNTLDILNPRTFEVAKEHFIVDQGKVYVIAKRFQSCQIQEIKGLDPENFDIVPIDNGDLPLSNTGITEGGSAPIKILTDRLFTKDSEHVYIGTRLINGADPQSFRPLNLYYSVDDSDVFYHDKENIFIVLGADRESFDVTDKFYAEDAFRAYAQGKPVGDSSQKETHIVATYNEQEVTCDVIGQRPLVHPQDKGKELFVTRCEGFDGPDPYQYVFRVDGEATVFVPEEDYLDSLSLLRYAETESLVTSEDELEVVAGFGEGAECVAGGFENHVVIDFAQRNMYLLYRESGSHYADIISYNEETDEVTCGCENITASYTFLSNLYTLGLGIMCNEEGTERTHQVTLSDSVGSTILFDGAPLGIDEEPADTFFLANLDTLVQQLKNGQTAIPITIGGTSYMFDTIEKTFTAN